MSNRKIFKAARELKPGDIVFTPALATVESIELMDGESPILITGQFNQKLAVALEVKMTGDPRPRLLHPADQVCVGGHGQPGFIKKLKIAFTRISVLGATA